MKMHGRVEHSQSSLHDHTQGRIRAERLALQRSRIAQRRTGPALEERVGMGRSGCGDLCGTQYSFPAGKDRQLATDFGLVREYFSRVLADGKGESHV